MAAPAAALTASRVDLLDVIDAGIPEREWVPGSPIFQRGRRYLFPGAAGSCKSLAELVQAVDMVAAGATVAIIDVENGGDEYARRLADVLADRPAEVREAVAERLRYYAWPSLSLEWSADEWAAALAGCDLVIFDSSRLVLSSVGLAEDKADDYAHFVAKLILPLTRAGITTAILDNTGWGGDHARGSSAKRDLCEVEYAVKRNGRVYLENTGEVEFSLARSRFPEQSPRLVMEIGGGTYGPLTEAPGDADDRPPTRVKFLQDRLVAIIAERGPLSQSDALRAAGEPPNSGTGRRALRDATGQGLLVRIDGLYSLSDGGVSHDG